MTKTEKQTPPDPQQDFRIFAPGDFRPNLVLSLKPRWAQKILNGTKRVEVWRRFSRTWAGSHVLLYASTPVKAVVGSARIREIEHGSPELLWTYYGNALGCRPDELEDYCHGCSKVWGLALDRVHAFRRTVSLEELQSFVGSDLRPPQAYAAVKTGSPWATALPLIEALQQ